LDAAQSAALTDLPLRRSHTPVSQLEFQKLWRTLQRAVGFSRQFCAGRTGELKFAAAR